MKKIINLIQNPLVMCDSKGNILTILKPSGNAFVVQEEIKETIDIEGKSIKLSTKKYSSVKGLPNPTEDTIYIVSPSVLDALKKERNDIFTPDKETAIYKYGHLYGFKQLIR